MEICEQFLKLKQKHLAYLLMDIYLFVVRVTTYIINDLHMHAKLLRH